MTSFYALQPRSTADLRAVSAYAHWCIEHVGELGV